VTRVSVSLVTVNRVMVFVGSTVLATTLACETAEKSAPELDKPAPTAELERGPTPPPALPTVEPPAAHPADLAEIRPQADPAPQATELPGAAKETLLSEAKNVKTTDGRATKALDEAEKAGATATELATAANARGQAIMGDAERASKLFQWARDKDPKFAEASFNLAKLAALTGDVEAARAHLQEVAKRAGKHAKKLLKQVEYDPIFEPVKDDPEIQKLLR